MQNSVLIIGCGSTGLATAAYLTAKNVQVTLCDTPEQSASFEAAKKQGGIALCGAIEQAPVMPCSMTCDFESALAADTRVLVCVSAKRHQEIAERIAPLLTAEHKLLIVPGNLGSVVFRKALQQCGNACCSDVLIGELGGNLWACREIAPAKILLGLGASPKKAAAQPCACTPQLLDAFGDLFVLTAAKNIMETVLSSPNVVSHLCGAIMNTAQIEREKESFALFETGLSDTVIRCLTALEGERALVMKALDMQVPPSDEGFYHLLAQDPVDPKFAWFKSLKGPSGMEHRYLTEDALCGVALLVSLARKHGIAIPLTESFLTIAQQICGVDFLAEGRTIEKIEEFV